MNSTSNELYLTFKDGGSEAFETVLHIGCKKAKDETEDSQIISKIWSEFTDCDVNTKTGKNLYYYKDGLYTSNMSVANLLKNGNGQCGAWVQFFQDINKIQGIKVRRYKLVAAPKKKYDFSKEGLELKSFFIKTWTPKNGANKKYLFENKNFENYNKSAVEYTSGTKGQGPTAKPLSEFRVHFITGYKDQTGKINIYDPSYGLTYSFENIYGDFEKNIEGWSCSSTDGDLFVNKEFAEITKINR